MKDYLQADLIRALQEIGLKKGDVALVSTELFAMGKLKTAQTKEELCRLICEAILSIIGAEGTLAVNAYTTYTQRYGLPFDRERSRPTTGVFSEYILFHPDSIRSTHPIHSVAALGKYKEKICLDTSPSNYGFDSPVDRMLNLNCQILRLGVDFGDNVFTHYVEGLYGLPYFYNKLLDVDVVVDGKKTDRLFFATVRHLNLTMEDNYEPIKAALVKAKRVYSAAVGDGWVHRIDAKEYCRTLIELLNQNPWALVKNPPNFKKGEIPFDGATKGRDGVETRANFLFEELRGTKSQNQEPISLPKSAVAN